MEDKVLSIMGEYSKQRDIYSDFVERLELLLNELLTEKRIRVHSIASRVKKADSLVKKVEKTNERYSSLAEITDLAGIRIITYFEDEVDRVAKIIEKEFEIDKENSVDKRKLLDPDRFGYLSFHYVVSLNKKRCQLTENKRFKQCKAEIQIRSILQHTWAEVEHDLGYKSKHSIPKEIRRSFSRLASLLEIADLEFVNIRESLKHYEKSLPKQITDNPQSVLIDLASLRSFVQKSKIVKELDLLIGKHACAEIITDDNFLSYVIDKLNYFKFKNIADIENNLRKHKDMIMPYVTSIMTSKYKRLSAGICIFYMFYAIAGKTNSTSKAFAYLDEFNIGTSDERNSFAEKIVSWYKTNLSKNQ